MQFQRVLNAFAKNGVTVTTLSEGYSYKATKGTQVLHFYQNGRDSGSVLHFTYRSPHTDASTDCFCDSYYNTIKAALHFLNGA